ncbi:MAG: DUF1553 domain-containing protein [Saprospiraceae bacterium]|nr:DUF1553 domain-containing protein [Saprospiraceae bacterium]
MTLIREFVGLWLLIVLFACHNQPNDMVSFNRDIRPIFNAKCLRCHGGVKANGDLSLLFEEDAFKPTQSGYPAIVPGKSQQSQLYKRLIQKDPELRMPLENPPLTEQEIKLIGRWIDQGAKWEKHWAYIKPAPEVQPPAHVKDTSHFIGNDIDLFVLQKLGEKGLSPNPKADPGTLKRRLFLDLTGLPPNQSELEKYFSAESPHSIEDLVDSLIASPHYGERWASMWLDLARYADTKGYEKDQNREIWRFRDYVIDAFNADKPFDQFSIEQLAGDLLPNPSEEQLIATAFHRNSMSNDEGGTDDEEFRIASVIERVSTTYEVWQSTTMACVQCHSHPYDPFRHEDFYRSMAYFNNAEDRDNYNENPKLATYYHENKEEAKSLIDWFYQNEPSELLPPRTGSLYDQRTALLDKLRFRSTEAENYSQSSPFIEIIWPDLDMLWQTQDSSWVKFEKVDLDQVEKIGFVAATELNYAGDISVHLDSLNGPEIGRTKITRTGHWNGWQGSKPSQKNLLREFKADIKQTSGQHDIYFRFWVGDTYIQHLFYLDKINYYEKNAPYLQLTQEGKNQLNKLFEIPTTNTPIIQELNTEHARKTFVFDRGSWLSPGEQVEEEIPNIFQENQEELPKNRLDFAHWLVSTDNPLSARVIVNRIWEQIFGRGLVETMEEFGTQGDLPSHPELLDWLADRLMYDYHWQLKPLVREIVLSGTYQQSSDIDSTKIELDPDNRWLSHGPRVRLSAEQIRDQMITISGLLNPSVGGPSVIIPDLKISDSQVPKWALTDPENYFRRSLYIFWKRTDPYANLITFDSPDRTVCTSRRIRTNTPLQALNLLNDETYLQASYALAKKMHFYKTYEAQIKEGYFLVTGQKASEQKLKSLKNLYEFATEKYQNQEIPEIIKEEIKDQSNQNELAALTLVANVLFNMDEFVVKK